MMSARNRSSSIMQEKTLNMFMPISDKGITEAESRVEVDVDPNTPHIKVLNETERKLIQLERYKDDDEAKYKLKDCLLNPRAKIDVFLLNDDRIFNLLKEGLTEKQTKWLKEKRERVIAEYERNKQVSPRNTHSYRQEIIALIK